MYFYIEILAKKFFLFMKVVCAFQVELAVRRARIIPCYFMGTALLPRNTSEIERPLVRHPKLRRVVQGGAELLAFWKRNKTQGYDFIFYLFVIV